MGRSKNQWIRETGGFRLGESDEEFLQRAERIAQIRKAISAGTATASDVDALSRLLGADEGDE